MAKIYTLTQEQRQLLQYISDEGRVYVPICGDAPYVELEEAGLVHFDEELQRQSMQYDRDLVWIDRFATITVAGKRMLA